MKDVGIKLAAASFIILVILLLSYNIGYYFTTGEERITIESMSVERHTSDLLYGSVISTEGKGFRIRDNNILKVVSEGKTYDISTKGFNIKYIPNKIIIIKAVEVVNE